MIRINKNFQFFSVFLLTFVGLSLFGFFYDFLPIKRAVFNHQLAHEQYLKRIREFRHNGCESLLLKKPDILIIGDSHSYSGYKLDMAQAHSEKTIGACILPGNFLKTAIDLLKLISESTYRPQKIILGLSPHFLTTDQEGYEKRVVENKKLLDTAFKMNLLNFVSLIKAIDNKTAFSTYSTYGEDLLLYKDKLKNYLSLIDEKLPLYDIPDRTYDISSYCNYIEKLSTQSLVLHIPESPFLEKNYVDYSQYQNNIKSFSSCSQTINYLSQYYGLENLDYMNRTASKQYFKILNTKSIKIEDRRSIFDFDHMNDQGARKFTQKIIEMGIFEF